jgi:hypothetical protein
MGLDQLPTMQNAHHTLIGTHLNLHTDPITRDRVERLADLNMMIAMHPTRAIQRDVIATGRCWQQTARFQCPECFERAALCCAVHP